MKERRKTARGLIIAYLENSGGEAPFSDLLPIYHTEYAKKRYGDGRMCNRPDLATGLLQSMNVDGIVSLSYGFSGEINRVRLVSATSDANDDTAETGQL